MKLLVGLGNPGSDYAGTRHNVGFMAVDEIVRRYPFDGFQKKFKGQIATGTIEGEKVYILKPETFMNLSGESVQAICAFYKINPEDVIVFHDDMDLPLAKLKVKQGGGAGGHNGLKSIDAHIGQNYHRVRIGVDKPVIKEQVIDWVLSRFHKDEKPQIESVIEKIAIELPVLLTKESQVFMNKVKL